MNIAIWIVQGLLAALFGMAGVTKSTQSYDNLRKQMPWVRAFSLEQVRIIGFLEFLGGIGIILPALTGILPWLTPVAATGLALTMLGAMLTHIRLKEYPMLLINLVLLAMAAFVMYGRFIAEPL